jgi:hypothetical protein
MDISTYETWQEEERRAIGALAVTRPEYVQHEVDHQREQNKQRDELLVRFSYSVVATGIYPEHDYACRWCWQNISPADGWCIDWYSEYPTCPLVMETEHMERGTRTDKSGEVLSCEWKRYANPGEHRHEGQWSFLWLGKTGYDYGYGEYCFTREGDRVNFLAALPTFTWSEFRNGDES